MRNDAGKQQQKGRTDATFYTLRVMCIQGHEDQRILSINCAELMDACYSITIK